MRKLRKRAPAGELRARRIQRHKEALGFDAERRELFDKLKAHAADCNEQDPVRFLIFLRQQRRGYDPGHDGKSPLMQLVDDIDALDERERQWAENGRKNRKPVADGAS